MLRFALSAALLLAAMPLAAEGPDAARSAPAADKKEKKPKSRTVKQLVELAVERGEDADIPADMAELLGFGAVDTATKRLRYEPDSTPDGKEHAFGVVLGKNDSGRPVPKALRISVVEGKASGDEVFMDGYMFRASLAGALEKAFHNSGKSGEVESKEVAITDPGVKARFRAEMNFHLREALRLGLELVK
ncbi:MAG: hypothetical protein HY554_00665 [Elusimicrobia bacterium]|nr:hypothetical protein [Elusimicrobiota bacterium]